MVCVSESVTDLVIVDDGTGIITCTFWNSERMPPTVMEDRQYEIRLGCMVRVWGKITIYKEQKKINVFQMCMYIALHTAYSRGPLSGHTV